MKKKLLIGGLPGIPGLGPYVDGFTLAAEMRRKRLAAAMRKRKRKAKK